MSANDYTNHAGTAQGTDPDPNHDAVPNVNGVQSEKGSDRNNEHDVAGEVRSGDGSEKAPPRTAHGVVWFLIVASILMANFLFATDNTITATIQPSVIQTFQSLDKLSWLGPAFLMSSWGTNFLWGDIYARFSSKWTFCLSFVVFAVGCAVAGAAPSMDALIVARAVCGLGGAGMYFGSMTLLTQMTSDRERPFYVNLVGITFGGGTVLGPIIGGAFAASSATWRWAFYFNLVVGAVCAPIYIFLLPTLNPRSGQSVKERALEIDYLGVVLVVGLIISITMAICFGGVLFPWNSSRIIALLVLSFVLLWLFLAQQHWAIATTPERRMFPMHFLKSSTMVVLFVELACCATNVFVPVYFLPLYFQFVKGDSAIIAGVRMLPYVVSQSVVGVLSGFFVSKTGYYVPCYIFAGVFCIAGAATLYTVSPDTPLANVYGYETLLGIGSCAATQLTFAVASVKVGSADVARSTGWEAFAQLGGPTISLSVSQAIFVNKAQSAVAALLPNSSVTDINTIISDPSSSQLKSLTPEMQREVLGAIVSSMRNSYIVCLVAACLILLLIFRFKVNDRLWK